jgi:hypothetical protein
VNDDDNRDIAALFAELGTLDVPRQVDPGTIRARGLRRARRRRMLAGAGAIGGAAALVAGTVAVSGALLADPAPDLPAAGPSQRPTKAPSSVPTPPSVRVPGPRGPQSDWLSTWTTRWQQQLVARGLRLSANASMADLKHRKTETHGAVRRGGSVGYVAFMATTDPAAVQEARRDPCRISRFPKGGVGGQCRQQDGYWVKTYRDSNQGRVVLVRVVTDRADVLLAQSVAFPSYQPSISDSVDLLPWDFRDPVYPEDPSRDAPWPPLDRDPLPTEDLAAVATTLAHQ